MILTIFRSLFGLYLLCAQMTTQTKINVGYRAQNNISASETTEKIVFQQLSIDTYKQAN